MSVPVIQTAFASGEISPSLFGHVDLAKFHSAASTMRNMFVSYRGGAYSRAGTAFVGVSKQSLGGFAGAPPPRLIPFQFSTAQGLCLEFGDHYMRVIYQGAYVLDTVSATIASVTLATPGVVVTTAPHGFSTFDYTYFDNNSTMLNLNGNIYVINKLSSTSFSLLDAFGNPASTLGYVPFIYGTPYSTATRVFTFTTPWAAVDLEYLKYTQSANTMTLCCVNSTTGSEYPPYDLVRGAANNSWTLTEAAPVAAIAAPASITGRATTTASSGASPTVYQYVATAVDAATGEESPASPVAIITNSVEIDVTAGSEVIECSPTSGAGYYNYYKAPPAYNVYNTITGYSLITSGSLFGFIGTSYGTTFVDNNITADYSRVPPIHNNPFAHGQILTINTTSAGDPVSAVTATINTTTGSGFSGYAVIGDNGVFQNFVVTNSGSGYAAADTITLVPTFISGSVAPTASLVIGPQSGTYPAVPGYFQERRVFASTINNPDTLWMSQSGAFNNFDSRVPPIDTDSIVATPWSVQVNGVQWLVPMPGGLVVLTGLSAWQVTGAGSSIYSVQPITPSGVSAQPQAYNGISSTVPPIRIDFDILYVQAKGSIVRDISYQFFQNIYTGTDLTQLSSHLFIGHTIKQWAWCEEPYKVIWAVRDDGVLLSLTILKQQEVLGWARHDTAGLFESVCAVTEPPVDALYCCVRRIVNGSSTYIIERMDNRLWNSAETSWCVDSGIAKTGTIPANSSPVVADANLIVESVYGLGAIASVVIEAGGTGYSSGTTVTVADTTGAGVGAVLSPVITGGVLTGVTVSMAGSGYVTPKISISDPAGTGSGASAHCVLDNSATFYCLPVLTVPTSILATLPIGTVIRGGNGIAITTSTVFTAGQFDALTVNIVAPFTATVPGVPALILPGTYGTVLGDWEYSTPITVVYGLNHLAGLVVTGLADGIVIPPQMVSPQGTITLANSASQITIGLAYQAQLQSVYLDAGSPTVQGQRKKIAAVTARLEASRGIKVGANQPDGSVQNPPQIAPNWKNLSTVPDTQFEPPYGNLYSPYPFTSPQLAGGVATPLYTGDVRIPVSGGFARSGQVALQQDYPLPMNVLALVPEVWVGDTPQIEARPRQQGTR